MLLWRLHVWDGTPELEYVYYVDAHSAEVLENHRLVWNAQCGVEAGFAANSSVPPTSSAGPETTLAISAV